MISIFTNNFDNEIKAGLEAVATPNFVNVEAKVYSSINMPSGLTAVWGYGYTTASNGDDRQCFGGLNGTCQGGAQPGMGSMVAGDTIKKTGWHVLTGIAHQSDHAFDFGKVSLVAEAGYKIGEINGLSASIAVEHPVTDFGMIKQIGLKTAYTRVNHDVEDINHVGVFATARF